jgi:sugar/nucleoside kinase (ribokinase family)
MPLLCTGTIGIDTVYTPHGHAEGVLGGSCTYFAAAASFYGPVRIVAAAGGDLPPAHLAVLRRFGRIDTTGLEIRPKSRTFAWGGRYHANMNSRETLFTELGVLVEAPPVVPPSYSGSRFIFLANSHPSVQLGLLEQFPGRALAVADTMDLWIKTTRPELDRLLRKVDGLVLNYDEAELLTGKSNPVTAARHILEMGPRFVVVKKGEHGCLLIHKDGIAALPAYPSETVIDPTGAGDSFAGGMMGHLALAGEKGGENPVTFAHVRRALAHGTIAASFTIESFSLDRLASLTREELDRRFDEYGRMVSVV